MPFTANYELKLSGSEGSAYNSGSGGYGYTLTKQFRLEYGDRVKILLPVRPQPYVDGNTLVIPSGDYASLYINDELIWRAGGGYGKINDQIAPEGVTSVKVQNGNKSYHNCSVHYHTGNSSAIGGCYGLGYFTGIRTVDKHCDGTITEWIEPITSMITNNVCHCTEGIKKVARCNKCGLSGSSCANHGYTLNSRPCNHVIGTQNVTKEYTAAAKQQAGDTFHYSILSCPYQQRQILSDAFTYTSQDCYYADGQTPTAELRATGNAAFSIKLCEQDTVLYKDKTVNYDNLYYLNDRCNLVLLDKTVCYFKRH